MTGSVGKYHSKSAANPHRMGKLEQDALRRTAQGQMAQGAEAEAAHKEQVAIIGFSSFQHHFRNGPFP